MDSLFEALSQLPLVEAVIFLLGPPALAATLVGWFVSKRLEAYKHRLSLLVESVRHEHQTRGLAFQLLLEKKHRVYKRLWRYLVVAEGAICRSIEFHYHISFEAVNSDDVRALLDDMVKEGLTRKQCKDLLDLYATDKLSAQQQINTFQYELRKTRARRAWRDAANYRLVNELYLSSRVSQESRALLELLQRFLRRLESHDTGDQRDLEEDPIRLALARLRQQLLTELRNGEP